MDTLEVDWWLSIALVVTKSGALIGQQDVGSRGARIALSRPMRNGVIQPLSVRQGQ